MRTINSWNIPLALLALSAGLLGFKYYQITNLRSDVSKASTKLVAARATVERESDRQQVAQLRISEQTKDEEAIFVNDLRMRAAKHNLVFVRWNASPPEPVKPAEGNQPVVPADQRVIPLKANVEVEGAYSDIRKMVDGLMSGSRFVVTETASWERTQQGTASKLAFSITRFVYPMSAAAPASQASRRTEQGGS